MRVLLALAMALACLGPAQAYEEGQLSRSSFLGCDSPEQARAFFVAVANKTTATEQTATCGIVRGHLSMYVREVLKESVQGGVIYIHEVKLVDVEGTPSQFVGTFEKLEDA